MNKELTEIECRKAMKRLYVHVDTSTNYFAEDKCDDDYDVLYDLINDYFKQKEEIQTLLDTQDTLVKRAKEMQWKYDNFDSVAKLYDALVDENDKLERALDKACQMLTELDECLTIYKHYPEGTKTFTKEEWKAWAKN